MHRQFSSLLERFQLVKSDYLRNRPALTAPPPPPDVQPVKVRDDAAIQPQAVIMDEASELAMLQRETEEILRRQRALTILQKQIGEVIQRDHATVVRIDRIVEEAKDNMVEGNENICVAERDQKGCLVA
jgi:hypothetical protein